MGDQPLGTPLKNPFTWLHLADVRFGAKDSLAAESMWDALESDVFTALPKDGPKPQAVFLTGSITATGTEPDFVMAEKRFARWVRFLGLDPKTRWFVSPGPGDVDREALTDFERRFRYSFQSREEENKSLAEAETWKLFSKRQTAFLAFTERFLGRRRVWAPEQPWTVDRLELDHGVNGATVAILSLNGSWACQDAQDPGNLLLGEVQVASLLRGARDVSLKIGLLSQDWEDFKRFDGRACQQRLTGRDGVHFLLQTGSTPAIQSNNDPGFTYHVFRGGDRTKEGPTAMIGQADLESGKGRIDAWSYDSQRRFWHKANHFYLDMQNGSWPFTWNPNSPKPAQPAAAAGLVTEGRDETAKPEPSQGRRREAEAVERSTHSQHIDKERKIATKPEAVERSAHSQHIDKERKIATKPEASPGDQVRAQTGATDYQPGQMIGPHYEVIKRLGAGASGVVYKVRSQDGDIEALKLSKADMFHSDKSRRRFIRELRTARQLSHDRLVPLFNLEYLPKGAVFYTMKFMSGGDLSRKLAEAVRTDSHLKPQQVLTWMGQVAEALAYIHKKGMVHQDVKPGNILLGENNEAYLGDFGLIFKYLSPNSLESLSETRTRVGGSPQFMSPEQQKVVFYQRETKITAASDSYSFGLTLYALLTGEMGGRTDPLASFLGESSLTEKLDGFLSKCLRRDPKQRFANGTELGKALAKLMLEPLPETDVSLVTPDENRRQAEKQEQTQEQVSQPSEPLTTRTGFSAEKPSSESLDAETAIPPVVVPGSPPNEDRENLAHSKSADPNANAAAPSAVEEVRFEKNFVIDPPALEPESSPAEANKPNETKEGTTVSVVVPIVVALIALIPFLYQHLFKPQTVQYRVKKPHVAMDEQLFIIGNDAAGKSKKPLTIKLEGFMYADAAQWVDDDPPTWQFVPGNLPGGKQKLKPGTYKLHVGASDQKMLELTKITIEDSRQEKQKESIPFGNEDQNPSPGQQQRSKAKPPENARTTSVTAQGVQTKTEETTGLTEAAGKAKKDIAKSQDTSDLINTGEKAKKDAVVQKPWSVVDEVVAALEKIASNDPQFAKNSNVSQLKKEIAGARGSSSARIPRDLYQKLQEMAVKGLETTASTAKQRQELGLALGRLGDPRLGLERRERWVALPAETFTMGNNQSRSRDEKPAHKVTLTQPFWIGRYPVTNEEFRVFVDGGDYNNEEWWSEQGRLWRWNYQDWLQRFGYSDSSYLQPGKQPRFWNDERFNQPNQPVVGVSWYAAEAFCRWLTARFEANPPDWWQPGMSFSLPTEAQWEYTARGKAERAFPWGSENPDHERANFSSHLAQPNVVGIYPKGATPEGVGDMAGGTWEWCLDTYDKDAFEGREGITEDPVV